MALSQELERSRAAEQMLTSSTQMLGKVNDTLSSQQITMKKTEQIMRAQQRIEHRQKLVNRVLLLIYLLSVLYIWSCRVGGTAWSFVSLPFRALMGILDMLPF